MVEQGKFYIVRATAGVFAGEILSRNGTEVDMQNARRLWYWSGAASLSELALRGVSRPTECKFPPAVPRVLILGAIEILEMSDAARASIDRVAEWKEH